MTIQEPVRTSQYDHIGKTYKSVEQLPEGKLVERFVADHIGDVRGLRVLDLACGTGYYTRKLVEWGAQAVTGVDISHAMIETARTQTKETDAVRFVVADCAEPLDEGRFDLVFASWLLDYASNAAELGRMWRNVFDHLEPGGRFVCILHNFRLLGADVYPLLAAGQYHYAGVGVQLLDQDANGRARLQVNFHTEPPVAISCYMLPQAVHEECARKAGMQEVRWIEAPVRRSPDGDAAHGSLPPSFQMVTAVRPGLS